MIHPFEQTLSKLVIFGVLSDDEERQKEDFLLFVEERMIPKSPYLQFLEEFNKITGKTYRKADIKSRKLFYEFDATYSMEERLRAIRNAMTDPYIKNENPTFLNPEMICKCEMLNKYISYTAPKPVNNSTKKIVKDGDYETVQDF